MSDQVWDPHHFDETLQINGVDLVAYLQVVLHHVVPLAPCKLSFESYENSLVLQSIYLTRQIFDLQIARADELTYSRILVSVDRIVKGLVITKLWIEASLRGLQ